MMHLLTHIRSIMKILSVNYVNRFIEIDYQDEVDRRQLILRPEDVVERFTEKKKKKEDKPKIARYVTEKP
jgi:hypothetical protein